MSYDTKTHYRYSHTEPEPYRVIYESKDRGCSSYCSILPVVSDGVEIVSPTLYPVTILPIDDPGVKVGEVVLFPQVQMEQNIHTFYLPNDRRFEKLRVFWAGMLKEGWLRIE